MMGLGWGWVGFGLVGAGLDWGVASPRFNEISSQYIAPLEKSGLGDLLEGVTPLDKSPLNQGGSIYRTNKISTYAAERVIDFASRFPPRQLEAW